MLEYDKKKEILSTNEKVIKEFKTYHEKEEKQITKNMAYCFMIFLLQMTLLFISYRTLNKGKDDA